MKTPMSCAHRHLFVSNFHPLLLCSYLYYVTLRTLPSAPVYGILCTSQGPFHLATTSFVLYLCIITLAIEGFGVEPDYL